MCASVICEQHRGEGMGRPHPMEFRTRVVDFVEEGNTQRATAAHFRVSIKFVNDIWSSGSARQGHLSRNLRVIAVIWQAERSAWLGAVSD